MKHNIDKFKINDEFIFVSGWAGSACAVINEAVLHVDYRDKSTCCIAFDVGVERSDVYEHNPQYGKLTGFELTSPILVRNIKAMWIQIIWSNQSTTKIPLSITEAPDISNLVGKLKSYCTVTLSAYPISVLKSLILMFLKAVKHAKSGNFKFLYKQSLSVLLSLYKAPKYESYTKLNVNQKVVLVIDHNGGGGANAYREQIVMDMVANGTTVSILVFNRELLTYQIELRNSEKSLYYLLTTHELDTYATLGRFEKVILNNLVTYPDLDFMLTFLKRSLNRGAFFLFNVHDYYSICPSIYLVNDSNYYCGLPTLDNCSRCYKNNFYKNTKFRTSITDWRSLWNKFYELSDEIFVFSMSSSDHFVKIYPEFSNKVIVKPHAITPFLKKYIPPTIESPSVTVAVVGDIGLHKGSQFLDQLVKLNYEPDVEFIVIGNVHDSQLKGSVKELGAYRREDLPSILTDNNVSLVLMLSICPETFSYVTHEIMSLGVPMLSFPIGAQGEAIKTYRLGSVCCEHDPSVFLISIYNKLRRIGCFK